ncbi:MAG TPA: glycosyltransferase [Methylomirabilota bacterium]|nr:glycosyltransferase [Methylomirabilota bacterium]
MLTEPFIEQRVRSGGPTGELWTERVEGVSPIPARLVDVGPIRAGSTGDRAFHWLPAISRPFSGGYAEAARAFQPDVIHAHYLPTGYLVGSRTTTPLVVSTYGFDVNLIPRRPTWRDPIARVADRASAILVEGPVMRDTVIDLGFRAAAVRIVPIAANLDGVRYRDPVTDAGPVHLVSCGRMIEKKGHDLAIRAFDSLRNDLPAGSTLTLVGDGPLRADLERLAARSARGTAVTFAGSLDRASYLARLATMHILVAASRRARNGDGEGGAPTTILDAQAVGVVAVGSRHQDIPSLIDDSTTGYLVDEDDVESLADGIRRAIAARPGWRAMTRRARAAVDERHTDRAVSRLLHRIHTEIAGS